MQLEWNIMSPREFQWCLKKIKRLYEVSSVFYGSFKDVSKKFYGVYRKFQGCFKEVLRVFQESFKSV